MAIEIERKFLIRSDGWRAQVARSTPMRQGYLGGSEGRASVRVRVTADRAWLNIKAAVLGSARAEYEYAIPLDEANQMLDTLCVGLIDKVRHEVEIDGHRWEIDEFAGANAGLVVAELELSREDEPFSRPDWLGREVTAERRYYNHALALHPYREWESASSRESSQ
jgi:adenylate cyclase